MGAWAFILDLAGRAWARYDPKLPMAPVPPKPPMPPVPPAPLSCLTQRQRTALEQILTNPDSRARDEYWEETLMTGGEPGEDSDDRDSYYDANP